MTSGGGWIKEICFEAAHYLSGYDATRSYALTFVVNWPGSGCFAGLRHFLETFCHSTHSDSKHSALHYTHAIYERIDTPSLTHT